MNFKTLTLITLILSLAMGSDALNAMENDSENYLDSIAANWATLRIETFKPQDPGIAFLAEIITPLESKTNNNTRPKYEVLASLELDLVNKRVTNNYYQDDESLSEISLKPERPDFTNKKTRRVKIYAQITVNDGGCETDKSFEELLNDVPLDIPIVKPFPLDDDQESDLKLFMRFTAITKPLAKINNKDHDDDDNNDNN